MFLFFNHDSYEFIESQVRVYTCANLGLSHFSFTNDFLMFGDRLVMSHDSRDREMAVNIKIP